MSHRPAAGPLLSHSTEKRNLQIGGEKSSIKGRVEAISWETHKQDRDLLALAALSPALRQMKIATVREQQRELVLSVECVSLGSGKERDPKWITMFGIEIQGAKAGRRTESKHAPAT